MQFLSTVTVCTSIVVPAGGCMSPRDRARLNKEVQTLREEVVRLQRDAGKREAVISAMQAQVRTLKGFGADRPADLFAPVAIEIVSRSGGQDYDGIPGDDGVTLYVRPKDADGDAVKVPGRLTVQLLDNSDLDNPRLVGVYHFNDPQRLRKLWYGKLGTQHYTLKCPFPAGFRPPRQLDARVEFVDYLTGKTLVAIKGITVTRGAAGD